MTQIEIVVIFFAFFSGRGGIRACAYVCVGGGRKRERDGEIAFFPRLIYFCSGFGVSWIIQTVTSRVESKVCICGRDSDSSPLPPFFRSQATLCNICLRRDYFVFGLLPGLSHPLVRFASEGCANSTIVASPPKPWFSKCVKPGSALASVRLFLGSFG